MESDSDDLVPVFMPALVALLVHAEDEKGTPLTKDEVVEVRDTGHCIMMQVDRAREMDESRGYRDIDPENCWHDWQMARRELGRKPDLDPGPRFDHVRSSDAAYQQTIQDAHDTISHFREMLPTDGTPRHDALVKTKLVDGEHSAFMWLNNTAIEGDNFTAELFEVPDTLPTHTIGARYTVTLEEVMDWMVNEDGRLSGGFSLRYHRSTLSDPEKADFDQHIGVTEYASQSVAPEPSSGVGSEIHVNSSGPVNRVVSHEIIAVPFYHIIIPVIAITLAGCADSIRLNVAPIELFVTYPVDDVDATFTTIVRNSGDERLKLSRFETDLPSDFKLQWRHVETASGLKRGPELIAGYIDGRNLFPNVLDIEVGYEIHLFLQWQGADAPPSGYMSFKTNAPSIPNLKIPVTVVTQ